MFSIKNVFKNIGLYLLLAVSFNTFGKYQLNADASSVSFSTIKTQYIVEPAYFKKISGSIDKKGHLLIDIPLKSIETGIPIRNLRLQQLFFITNKYPNASIRATLDLKKINAISGYSKMEIPAYLSLYGKTKEINLSVIVGKHGCNLTANTSKPIIINANDYGIPAQNLINLAKTVGGISISPIVPVNFSLAFNANK